VFGNKMREVTLKLKPSKDAPRVSRSRLAEMRDALGRRYDDAALIVSELVTNSVRHSGETAISVTVQTLADRVRVEVTDGGPCFDPGEPRGEGLGLAFVEKLADRWGVENSGPCTVWVELELERA
jgi:anti-sigma regulatory factor (Ser/Thr protein kinase)